MPFSIETHEDVVALQQKLSWLGYLDPPADGAFGKTSIWALNRFCAAHKLPLDFGKGISASLSAAIDEAEPLPFKPGADLAGRIARSMLRQGYWVCRHPACYNDVYLEGANADGSPNDNRPDEFNDRRLLLRFGDDGAPQLVGNWEATTEPGRYWTNHPMSPKGAARIKFGQWKAWAVGMHHTHEALVQVAPVTVCRDLNRDFKRTGDKEDTGLFGINQHWGYDLPKGQLKTSSAGCLVGRSTEGHREFMRIIKSDSRHMQDPGYRFVATVMPASALAA